MLLSSKGSKEGKSTCDGHRKGIKGCYSPCTLGKRSDFDPHWSKPQWHSQVQPSLSPSHPCLRWEWAREVQRAWRTGQNRASDRCNLFAQLRAKQKRQMLDVSMLFERLLACEFLSPLGRQRMTASRRWPLKHIAKYTQPISYLGLEYLNIATGSLFNPHKLHLPTFFAA